MLKKKDINVTLETVELKGGRQPAVKKGGKRVRFAQHPTLIENPNPLRPVFVKHRPIFLDYRIRALSLNWGVFFGGVEPYKSEVCIYNHILQNTTSFQPLSSRALKLKENAVRAYQQEKPHRPKRQIKAMSERTNGKHVQAHQLFQPRKH